MFGLSDDFSENPFEDRESQVRKYVRPIRVSAETGESVDRRIVSFQLYNSFNFAAFLPSGQHVSKYSIGITSPNRGEGKTTAACNLAAAVAMGTGMKTVLIDFNIVSPLIHDVFGIPPGPGLAEAMCGGEICVAPTLVDNLYAMPAGNKKLFTPGIMTSFREVLTSLNNAFEFVLVDMPPAMSRAFPTIIANQLGGLLVVVRPKTTKRRDIDKLFRKLPVDRVLGFVMNSVEENDF